MLTSKATKIYEVIKYKVISINNVDIEEKSKEIRETNETKKAKVSNEKNAKKTNEDIIWQIKIPSIKLVAPINEGTSQKVMREYVGHFENTSIWNGNIGLAAHNRGFPINYFAKLKKLKVGDKIIYKIGKEKRTYIVKIKKVINETNWSYLEKTKDNRITLITCVANKPTKRLCIQGVEKRRNKNE